LARGIARAVVNEVRSATHRGVAVTLAVAAAAALVAIGTPRIPAVWSIVWGINDTVTGGVQERHELLVDHPFPATLAPSGYRVEAVEPIFDGEETLGVAVSFTGPDDENSISYYPHAMIAAEVNDYWRRGDDVFGLEPVAVEDLDSHSFCHEGDDAFHETHRVSCIAAFDGMAIIADSVNTKPGRGNIEHAVPLLDAGIEYWESIRD
jgi:hypothetical protein